MVAKRKQLRAATKGTGFIAFYNGKLVSDHILKNIIGAARRGLMTKAGENLLLMPDTRTGPPDSSGMRHIGPFRKSDCLTLKQLMRKERKHRELRRKPKKQSKNDSQFRDLDSAKLQGGTQVSDCRIALDCR